MNHVPYKGGGPRSSIPSPVRRSLLQLGSVALPHVKAGKLRAIAVTSSRRDAAVADVPTVAESALPGY